MLSGSVAHDIPGEVECVFTTDTTSYVSCTGVGRLESELTYVIDNIIII